MRILAFFLIVQNKTQQSPYLCQTKTVYFLRKAAFHKPLTFYLLHSNNGPEHHDTAAFYLPG